jgi:hypothetical protein
MALVFPPRCSISAAKLNRHTIRCSSGTGISLLLLFLSPVIAVFLSSLSSLSLSSIAIVIRTARAAYDTASRCLLPSDATHAKFVSTGRISLDLSSIETMVRAR